MEMQRKIRQGKCAICDEASYHIGEESSSHNPHNSLTELRSRYWLVRGRQFIRTQLGKCATCRKYEGKPYKAPPAPPLPEFRVNQAPPFTATGIDFLGPLYVKTKEKSSKVWIFLYTCCVVRALHLDVVPNLTSEGFMRSFRRFTARRGMPSTIITDNGRTF